MMATMDDSANPSEAARLARYPDVATKPRLPWSEAVLLVRYHLRIAGRGTFLLMLLGLLAAATLVWFQLRSGDAEGLRQANKLSLFVLEPGAGLLAAMLSSSLIMNDPLLEVIMATRTGSYGLTIWRGLLGFVVLLLCSIGYVAWSVGNGMAYMRHLGGPLMLLLLWLAPVLLMSALGLFGSLLTRNVALGMTIAALPLAGSLFLFEPLFPLQVSHPFLITYTYSAGQIVPGWLTNRLVLLGGALLFAILSCWLLRGEERLLNVAR